MVVMGLLAKCPRCNTTYVPGGPCPSCQYLERSAEEAEPDYITEYADRKTWHRMAYAAYMCRGLAIGAMGVSGILFCWIGLIGVSIVLLFALAVGVAAQFVLYALRDYREIHCPACDTRLDEIPLQDGCCPGCAVQLR